MREWPRDPRQLLGVKPGADAREVKRAYVRLIKIYKPEHYPKEFRRLRDAYEALQRLATGQNWIIDQGHVSISFDVPPTAQITVTSTPNNDSAPTDPGPVAPTSERIIPADPFESAWKEALAGNVDSAYADISRRVLAGDQPEEAYLRLYWLAFTYPQASPARTALDWLTQGLRVHGLSSRLGAIFRQRLQASPQEALLEPVEQLVLALSDPRDIADLLDCRWRACQRLGHGQTTRPSLCVETMTRDIESSAARILAVDELIWANLLFRAIEHAAWDKREPHADFVQTLSRQLNGAHHLHSRLETTFDESERLLRDARTWRGLYRIKSSPWTSSIAPHILDFVQASVLFPAAELEQDARQLAARIVESPNSALKVLDALATASPLLAARVSNTLYQVGCHCDLPELDTSRSGLAMVARNFVYESPWYKYQKFRHALLSFCCEEAIAPSDIAELIDEDPELVTGSRRRLSNAISADRTLECVYLAHRIFGEV
jgi:hypothetical protein